jgi:phosphopantetheinyl transferase (holo-ACP synthase)
VSPGGSPPLAAVLTGAVGELISTSGLSGAVVGVGVDAVDLDRFRRVLERRVHLADRLFTAGEQAYAAAASDPVPRLSTRFAAKEATMKALGVGLGALAFAEVEVVRAVAGPARFGSGAGRSRRGVALAPLADPHRPGGHGPGGGRGRRSRLRACGTGSAVHRARPEAVASRACCRS